MRGVYARTPNLRGTLLERLIAKVDASPSGCWLWIGCCNYGGYGQIWAGRSTPAHRVSYTLFIGPIPEGLELDHLCGTPACVNPTHLEPVTPQVNTLRGNTLGGKNARKTHCAKGHPFDEMNTRHAAIQRRCRTCDRVNARAASQRYRHRKKGVSV